MTTSCPVPVNALPYKAKGHYKLIKSKILRRGDYLRLVKRVQENIRILIIEGRGKKESGKEK